jgi:2-haloacid dehalogenase
VGTVAFDMIGTFFSLDRARRAIEEAGAPPHALELWLAQGLRDAFAWSHAGGYAPFAEILRASLVRTLDRLGVPGPDPDPDPIMATMRELDLVPGAEEACTALQDAGWRILALTNSSEEYTRALLDRAGMTDRFTALLSCDEVGTTKPHPDVYGLARKAAEGELWLVAAHGWDVAGAARAGLRTAWISALEGRYLEPFPRPDVTATDLPEAVQQILSRD